MTLKKLHDNKTQDKLLAAFKDGSEEAFGTAMVAFSNEIQDKVLAEAKQQNSDVTIMANRGQAQLTNQETKYYDEVVNNGGFDGTEELVPATIFERVFEDLENGHDLLSKIQFVNVTGVAEFITSRGVNPAWWGKLSNEIKEVLDNGFDVINMHQFKLSGYIPLSKAMLDLGPVWLDKYVRAVLVESLKIALEQAIVDGSGKDEPIGMLRDIKNVSEGSHTEKVSEPLADFSPKTLGAVMSRLSKINIEGVDKPYFRNVKPEDALLIVNPSDYWLTVYPAITTQIMDGSYRTGLPLPFTIITSVAVPVGKTVMGLGRDYFMGIGSMLKIEVSDEARFIEDQRVYLAKQYANGQPKSNESFIVFDLPEGTDSKKA
ncbi:major capsid protein [Dellaglioa algida]|nr:major capsid protein [Dellaglioa algida]